MRIRAWCLGLIRAWCLTQPKACSPFIFEWVTLQKKVRQKKISALFMVVFTPQQVHKKVRIIAQKGLYKVPKGPNMVTKRLKKGDKKGETSTGTGPIIRNFKNKKLYRHFG